MKEVKVYGQVIKVVNGETIVEKPYRVWNEERIKALLEIGAYSLEANLNCRVTVDFGEGEGRIEYYFVEG